MKFWYIGAAKKIASSANEFQYTRLEPQASKSSMTGLLLHVKFMSVEDRRY